MGIKNKEVKKEVIKEVAPKRADLIEVVLVRDYPTSKGIIKAGKKIKTTKEGVAVLKSKNII
tara:strand:+ start:1114 stop:1299 length:186 start_codon:yes stop_codon:yes gene_type:complete